MNAARTVAKRLPLLPPTRSASPAGSRTGSYLSPRQHQAADHFWQCGVEVAKVIYTRIDARYPREIRYKDPEAFKAHQQKMDEAKKILNENRNEVFEAVMPLFDVDRTLPDAPTTDADSHAHDYIVCNYFDMMVRTYIAWADQFVEAEHVHALEETVRKVAALQRERLESWLSHYRFRFREVPLPAASSDLGKKSLKESTDVAKSATAQSGDISVRVRSDRKTR